VRVGSKVIIKNRKRSRGKRSREEKVGSEGGN
jgi:hypothetical protein